MLLKTWKRAFLRLAQNRMVAHKKERKKRNSQGWWSWLFGAAVVREESTWFERNVETQMIYIHLKNSKLMRLPQRGYLRGEAERQRWCNSWHGGFLIGSGRRQIKLDDYSYCSRSLKQWRSEDLQSWKEQTLQAALGTIKLLGCAMLHGKHGFLIGFEW